VGRRSKNRSKKPGLSLKARWLSWYASRSPVFRFGMKFGAWLALYYALFSTPFFEPAVFLPYLKANARLANAILLGLGQHTQVSDVTIQSPQFVMAIRRGCDAVEPTWLLCAAMGSFPAPFLHKLKGMLAGIVILQILNLVRIVTLYWIGIHLPGFFNSAHMEVWPTAFIVVAIVLFVVWKESSQRPESHVAA
jgi:exosortase/archaeosortase family protein